MTIDITDGDGPPPEYDLDELSRRLAEHAATWVPEYYARGRIDNHGNELRLANIRGAPPRREGSCVIKLKGDEAGCWYDHADGKGGKPLSTLAEATGLRGVELFGRAAEIVGTTPAKANGHSRPRGKTDEDRARDVAFILQ